MSPIITVWVKVLVLSTILHLISGQHSHEDEQRRELDNQFSRYFKELFGDNQTIDTIEFRKRIFLKNARDLNKYNEDNGVHYELNELSLLTPDETHLRLGLMTRDSFYEPSETTADFEHLGGSLDYDIESKKLLERANLKPTIDELIETLPKDFDWRLKNINSISEVKNQNLRGCGSCWAFATSGLVESQYRIKQGQNVTFSEQEIIDCDQSNHGCYGGYTGTALHEIMSRGGLVLESDYPAYGGLKNDECLVNATHKKYNIDGYVQLPSHREDIMRLWIYLNGPIAISMSVGTYFGYVTTDVYHPSHEDCPKDFRWPVGVRPRNHAVLVVGWGIDSENKPFWLVKNSWGKEKHVAGYFKVYRGDNTCGVETRAKAALLDWSATSLLSVN